MNKKSTKIALTRTVISFIVIAVLASSSCKSTKEIVEAVEIGEKPQKDTLTPDWDYLHYPDLKEVVTLFFDDYAIEETHSLDLRFEKRPSGWHVALYNNQPERQKINDRLYWCRENRAYNKIEIDTLFVESTDDAPPPTESFLNPHALMYYRTSPYYGYPGWDWDVISEYKAIKNLPDSIVYGLGNAYSSYASNLLDNNSGFAHVDHQFVLPDGKDALTEEQMEKYIHYQELAIENLSKVEEINPFYESFVGSIETKVSNEYLQSFLTMRVFQNEMQAQNQLSDGLYNDYIISAAKNYLNTCDPNAILFTYGDNDTYPLLYIQAQYGFRPDVLVINISLLNTYRYINSLREKNLEAEAVNLSVERDKYENRMREIVYVINRLNRPMELSRLMNFVWSDEPRSRVKTKTGDQLDFLPGEQVQIFVDMNAVIKSRTVDYEKKELIVDTIEWTLDQDYLLKSNLIMLDILATNNWDRPVYFTSMDRSSYMGMEDFFQLEGMAYRFVPIKKSNKDQYPGRVDTDILFDHLMNEFEWEDISDTYISEEYMTIGSTYSFLFSRLALALKGENKNELAADVIDRYFDMVPEKFWPS